MMPAMSQGRMLGQCAAGFSTRRTTLAIKSHFSIRGLIHAEGLLIGYLADPEVKYSNRQRHRAVLSRHHER